jgi:hypothetical protein
MIFNQEESTGPGGRAGGLLSGILWWGNIGFRHGILHLWCSSMTIVSERISNENYPYSQSESNLGSIEFQERVEGMDQKESCVRVKLFDLTHLIQMVSRRRFH